MKKTLATLLAIMGMAFCPWYSMALPWKEDDTVTISLSPSVSADPKDKWFDIGGYGGLFTINNTTTGAQIQTFCVELDEFISLGSTYYVQDVSNDIATQGGRNTDLGDQLSDSTKWLYYQFTLNPSGYKENQVRALQLAIWVLEDEYSDKGDFPWADWGEDGGAVGTLAKAYYEASLDKSTTADIRVLDLKDLNGKSVQSFVIRVPEPATLGMLGLGLLGFAIAARRIRRKV